MDGPATVERVRVMLRAGGSVADDDLAPVVAGVNAFVARLPYVEANAWADDVKQGANMLAARLYRRRNSPAGVESVSELGAVYVQRNDPDVAMMLGIGAYSRPIVG